MKAQALRGFGCEGQNQMQSKTMMTILAAAVLFLPTIIHAQTVSANSQRQGDSSSSTPAPLPVAKVNAPGEVHEGVTGWTFVVLTIRQFPKGSISSRVM